MATPCPKATLGYILKYEFLSIPRFIITRELYLAFLIYTTFLRDIKPSNLSSIGTPTLVFILPLVFIIPLVKAVLALSAALDAADLNNPIVEETAGPILSAPDLGRILMV